MGIVIKVMNDQNRNMNISCTEFNDIREEILKFVEPLSVSQPRQWEPILPILKKLAEKVDSSDFLTENDCAWLHFVVTFELCQRRLKDKDVTRSDNFKKFISLVSDGTTNGGIEWN